VDSVVGNSKRGIAAIVQARMGSTRLPGKTLVDICGRPLLEHIIERVKQSRYVNVIVVATTTNLEDDQIVQDCERLGVRTFRGNDLDVLDRFYQCAVRFDAEAIVRITADDPFKDPKIIDCAINTLSAGSYDYVSNTIRPTYPDGLDVEVFTSMALSKAWREAQKPSEREHVTPYIWKNPQIFRLKNLENDHDLSHLRWTLDTAEDLAFAREVYKRLYVPGQLFLMADILELLRCEPDLALLNSFLERNAGYKKSLMEESRT
jgi:spore coat polysaccharide biosynthesis protein SpsF